MPSLMFVMPVYGRLPLARICLRQLRRTCDALTDYGIKASAVVVADGDDLAELDDLGFGYVERDNDFLSRKFNDGIHLACDPEYNPEPADYVVPIGSDDWVDWKLFANLPPADTVMGFQRLSFVREDGREMTARLLRYEGGCGIRVYPRQLLEPLDYRPADEDRKRACDTSILVNVRRENAQMKVAHPVNDPRQIIDWKSPAQEQLNSYEDLRIHRGQVMGDPFSELIGFFPQVSLLEMRDHYRALVPA